MKKSFLLSFVALLSLHTMPVHISCWSDELLERVRQEKIKTYQEIYKSRVIYFHSSDKLQEVFSFIDDDDFNLLLDHTVTKELVDGKWVDKIEIFSRYPDIDHPVNLHVVALCRTLQPARLEILLEHMKDKNHKLQLPDYLILNMLQDKEPKDKDKSIHAILNILSKKQALTKRHINFNRGYTMRRSDILSKASATPLYVAFVQQYTTTFSTLLQSREIDLYKKDDFNEPSLFIKEALNYLQAIRFDINMVRNKDDVSRFKLYKNMLKEVLSIPNARFVPNQKDIDHIRNVFYTNQELYQEISKERAPDISGVYDEIDTERVASAFCHDYTDASRVNVAPNISGIYDEVNTNSIASVSCHDDRGTSIERIILDGEELYKLAIQKRYTGNLLLIQGYTRNMLGDKYLKNRSLVDIGSVILSYIFVTSTQHIASI